MLIASYVTCNLIVILVRPSDLLAEFIILEGVSYHPHNSNGRGLLEPQEGSGADFQENDEMVAIFADLVASKLREDEIANSAPGFYPHLRTANMRGKR